MPPYLFDVRIRPMKIVCDQCRAKYAIADDKIGDRMFKARCRRCGHQLLVGRAATDGAVTTVAPTPVPAATTGGNPLAVWYAVIGGRVAGPMTGAEVRTRFNAAELQLSSYVWCEGFERWLPIADVPQLSDLAQPIAGGEITRRTSGVDEPPVDLATPPAEATAARRAPVQDNAAPVGPSADDNAAAAAEVVDTVEADDIIAATPTTDDELDSSDVATEPTRREAVEDLLGSAVNASDGATVVTAPPVAPPSAPPPVDRSASPSSAATPSPLPPRPASPTVTAHPRREGSVLFRLRDLMSGARHTHSEGPPPRSPPRPGFASSATSGSGLVDMRQMAQAILEPPPEESSREVTLPLRSTVPVVMPQRRSAPWLWVVATVVVLVVAFTAAALTFFFIRQHQSRPPASGRPPSGGRP